MQILLGGANVTASANILSVSQIGTLSIYASRHSSLLELLPS